MIVSYIQCISWENFFPQRLYADPNTDDVIMNTNDVIRVVETLMRVMTNPDAYQDCQVLDFAEENWVKNKSWNLIVLSLRQDSLLIYMGESWMTKHTSEICKQLLIMSHKDLPESSIIEQTWHIRW